MGSSSSPSKTTTTTEPPAFIKPYLQYGAEQAKGLYNQGSQVVPFSPQTEQAMRLTEQRALNGSPVNQAAQGYATDVLNGKYLQGNPYADAAFNKAALATQNQLSSQFAGSGRNLMASMPGRSDQLNDLATQFYYNNYNDERNRQQGIAPIAPSLANQDYVDIAQLGGVGSQVEGLAQRYADAPGQALDQYIGRVTGGYPGASSTTTQPNSQNRGAGALGGALIGNMLFPGLGGIIGGGLLGGIL